jgi:hypothetical protein
VVSWGSSRDGRFWLIHVPEIDRHTQARHLREIDTMARDLVAVMTGRGRPGRGQHDAVGLSGWAAHPRSTAVSTLAKCQK